MLSAGSTKVGLWMLVLIASCGSAGRTCAADDRVKVTVVAILATDRNSEVDPELKVLAQEVQKVERSLTGFRLRRTTTSSLARGEEHKYPLVDQEVALVAA